MKERGKPEHENKDQIVRQTEMASQIESVDGNNKAYIVSDISNIRKEIVYSEFPVHSLVLCLNSLYFDRLLSASDMKENKENVVTVKVNTGQGKYLEKMIHAFYNEESLKELCLLDLLSLLNIAERFSCFGLLKYVIDIVNGKEIKSIEDCDSIIKSMTKFDHGSKVDAEANEIILKSTQFLSKELYPLEFKFSNQELFFNLHYVTIFSLLNSSYAVTVKEDNLFLFLYKWLSSNLEFQTGDSIGSLLTSIRYKDLSAGFIYDEITICDQMLNIWKGYPVWFSNLAKYNLLSVRKKVERGIEMKVEPARIKPCDSTLFEVTCLFSCISYEDATFSYSSNLIVWNGLSIVPVISLKTEESSNYLMKLEFICQNTFSPTETRNKTFHQGFDICFTVFPGTAESVNVTELLKDPKYKKRFLRHVEIKFDLSDTFDFGSIVKLDEQFLKQMKLNGICLMLFFRERSTSWSAHNIGDIKSSKKIIRYLSKEN